MNFSAYGETNRGVYETSITSKLFLIPPVLLFITFSIYIFPQKIRPSNSPERKQVNQTDHNSRDERKSNSDEAGRRDNTGKRKDHIGITIERPERKEVFPENTAGRHNPVQMTGEPAMDIISVPVIIPIIEKSDDPPLKPVVYSPPKKYDPISSGPAKLDVLDYSGALADFNYALKKDSGNYKLYYYRGLAYLNLKYYFESINDFDIFLSFYFYDMDGYFFRGAGKILFRGKAWSMR